jgi:predicted nucleic acid-binding protein
MTIVFDNNVVLDALLERKPFCDDAERLLTACVSAHTGALTANSLTDIFYVLSKFIGAAKAKQVIKKLTELFKILPVDSEDCVNALELPMDDFEDALLSVCASKYDIEYIVSRDTGFLSAGSPVLVITPGELLGKLFD